MNEHPSPRSAAGAIVLATLLTLASSARADSLRCGGTSVVEGDSKIWLLRNCGQPTLSDTYCTWVLPPTVPGPHGSQQPRQPVCLTTDEWLYDRGEGNLIAVVRVREGKIISIRFGEQGRSEPR